VNGWLDIMKKLLFQKSNEVLKPTKNAEDSPVISPKAECFVIRIVFEGQVSFSQWDQSNYCVVDETGEVLLHFLFYVNFICKVSLCLLYFINFLILSK